MALLDTPAMAFIGGNTIRESPAQFEDRIKPQEYVRRITRSTTYEKAQVSRNWRMEDISYVACGFSPIKSIFLITRKA